MTPRQKIGVTQMLIEITEEHRCIVSIEDDEVTVYDGHGSTGPHSHHRGADLYERMSKALATAKEYAAARAEFWKDPP